MFSGRAGLGLPSEYDEPPGINGAVVRELFATTGAVLMGKTMFDLGVGPWADTPSPCVLRAHPPAAGGPGMPASQPAASGKPVPYTPQARRASPRTGMTS